MNEGTYPWFDMVTLAKLTIEKKERADKEAATKNRKKKARMRFVHRAAMVAAS